MLVNCAMHTKTQCASAPKCATCTHVRVFFFRDHHPQGKLVVQNGLNIFVGRHTQSYPWQEPALVGYIMLQFADFFQDFEKI